MKLALDAWRRARNISQESLADACGVHVNTYRVWEQNPGEMRLDKVMNVAEILQIDMSDILLPSDTTETSKMEETEVR